MDFFFLSFRFNETNVSGAGGVRCLQKLLREHEQMENWLHFIWNFPINVDIFADVAFLELQVVDKKNNLLWNVLIWDPYQ